jgi:hypothetical protein
MSYMRDIFFTLLALFALFIALPVILLWTRDRIRMLFHRKTQQERDACQEARRQRMLHPNIEAVEALCGGLLPQKLIDLYTDSHLVLDRDFEVCAPGKDRRKDSWWIGDFVPLHRQDQMLTTDLTEFGKGCCFAGDGMGNFYWVPVDEERRSDAPVFFACHDPWENEKVADSLVEFRSWPRMPKEKRF